MISLPITEAKQAEAKLALVSFTTPGGKFSPILERVKQLFPNGEMVTHMPGWGKLTQKWYEIKTEIIHSEDWSQPKTLNPNQWDELLGFLNQGMLIMMIHYIDSEWLTPHH